MARLSLRSYTSNGEYRMELGGELDLSNAVSFDEALRRVERENPEVLVLDLSELKFLDSTGLRLIVSAHMRAQRSGRRVKLVEGCDAVRRIFRLTGVDERLDIVASAASD